MATKQEVFEMYQLIKKHFNVIHKSPYSNSFYSDIVDWGEKPDGVVRVSDHWNWKDREGIHCPTHQEIPDGSYVSIGIMRNGKFDIMLSVYKYDVNFYEGKWEKEHDKNYLYIAPNQNKVICSETRFNITDEYKDYDAFRLLVGTN